MEKTMFAYKSIWNEKETFKLMPSSLDCPFMEGFYDVDSKVLVIIGTGSNKRFQMMPRLKHSGEPDTIKKFDPATKQEALDYQQERLAVDVHPEFYISDPKDIKIFLTEFVSNNTHASIKEALTVKAEPKKSMIITK